MIRVELKGYAEAIEIWGNQPVAKAAASALKKVAAAARTVASEEIRNVYNVKKSDLDPRIEIRPPRASALVAEISISGKGLSLSYFGARQTTVNRVITRASKGGLKTKTMKRSAKFQGVTVEVEKGKRTQLKSAFLAMMISGHVGVMRRVPGKFMKGKNRQAITEKTVISIASMAQKASVQPAVLQRVQEAWDTIFPAELNYQLNVKGKTT